MPKINCLSREVAELIAAGEVIERPASIVKELIENAIDAKANRITVEIKNGGIGYIRVTDNGCGISKEDIPTAFVRHATSKVSHRDDLEQIMTMGFRGEALPSIAAVSHVEMISREEQEIIGTRYQIQGADEGILSDIGCPVGTSVIVRDLFYNVPARVKFLKKDVVEGNTVAGIVERIALANPNVGITFIREGITRFSTSGDNRLIGVIRLIMGGEISAAMLPAQWENAEVKVWGYITKPSASRANRAAQHFIINGRYVRSKTCGAALEEAYRLRLMGGRFPSCVLNVEVKPQNIDVNVHPAKLEVRFSDERTVYNAVYSACKNTLEGIENYPVNKPFNPFDLDAEVVKGEQLGLHPLVEQDAQTHMQQPTISHPKSEKAYSSYTSVMNKGRRDSETFQETNHSYREMVRIFSELEENKEDFIEKEHNNDVKLINFTDGLSDTIEADKSLIEPQIELSIEDFSESSQYSHFASDHEQILPMLPSSYLEEQNKSAPTQTQFRVLGEIFQCFIVCETERELILVDKHATHERIIYNRLKNEVTQDNRQIALINSVVMLRGDDYRTIIEYKSIVEQMGILFADIGDGTIIIKELALILVDFPMQTILEDIASHLRKNTSEITPALLDELLFSVSCRCAVMKGSKSNITELTPLAEMAINGDARHCPHGRPTTISLTQNEIHRMFGRS